MPRLSVVIKIVYFNWIVAHDANYPTESAQCGGLSVALIRKTDDKVFPLSEAKLTTMDRFRGTFKSFS